MKRRGSCASQEPHMHIIHSASCASHGPHRKSSTRWRLGIGLTCTSSHSCASSWTTDARHPATFILNAVTPIGDAQRPEERHAVVVQWYLNAYTWDSRLGGQEAVQPHHWRGVSLQLEGSPRQQHPPRWYKGRCQRY
ncbi:hypothetical protein GWK47_035441 [Chionoecetes opilio]|uniref:Uncharacterized protein n=1 Tax=Chionoecetes opilio TaxID=41210 RepID=A0A8J5D2E3_CHIOP|nr:hypothetical protein GWK47_035441 [Chionoecetes opilio]